MTGTKKDRVGLSGHIYVVGERSRSRNKPSVFTASHRFGNSELVCHGAWHNDEVTGVVVPLVPCSAGIPCQQGILQEKFPALFNFDIGLAGFISSATRENFWSNFPNEFNSLCAKYILVGHGPFLPMELLWVRRHWEMPLTP
jgi:hypothetical protein